MMKKIAERTMPVTKYQMENVALISPFLLFRSSLSPFRLFVPFIPPFFKNGGATVSLPPRAHESHLSSLRC